MDRVEMGKYKVNRSKGYPVSGGGYLKLILRLNIM